MSLTFNPFDQLVEAIETANGLLVKIQAATGNQDDQIKAVIETSDDAKLVKYRESKRELEEQIETLQAKLANGNASVKEYAKTLLTDTSDLDVEAAKKEAAAARKKATDIRKVLVQFASEEEVAAELERLGVPELKSVRGSGVKGSATGVKRPRISAATVDGETVAKPDGGVDFSFLAKELKTNANDLKSAAFAAAGTDDLNSLEAGTEVTFTVGDHTVVVTVSDKKPGRASQAE